MKSITVYRCDFCGERYSSVTECRECEKTCETVCKSRVKTLEERWGALKKFIWMGEENGGLKVKDIFAEIERLESPDIPY